ncbi:MAG TPA: type II toxin-antitoxin system HicA family toxin [Burkholderiaceae bacterium]|nr:type II toxin-antitoxin system HicA family toxin [Burkholderiaceae bacterium]
MPTKVVQILRQLQKEGWALVARHGSRRQYKHPARRGRVTIAGKPGDDVAPGMLDSIRKLAGRR